MFTWNNQTLLLQPNDSNIITITIYLTNPGKHKSTLKIEADYCKPNKVNLLCVGVGTSILCEPSLAPELNLGYLMTRRKYSFTVQTTNKAINGHKMLISRNPNLKYLKEEEQKHESDQRK